MSVTRARSFRRHMSPPEAQMWNVLRSEAFFAWHFRRQVPIGPYYADFASHRARLVVEIDGATHFEPEAEAHDARRTAFLGTQGYRVLRFTTTDVLANLDGVYAALNAALG